MNFFLTFLLLIVTSLSYAETPPPATTPAPAATTGSPAISPPTAANSPTGVTSPPAATTGAPTNNMPPPATTSTKATEPAITPPVNDKPVVPAPAAPAKPKTERPKENPLSPAKPECNIKSVMSDDEMRLCGIKIHHSTCQPANASIEIAKVQTALQAQNYYVGDITGVMDEHTKTAILVYKELNHLPINDVPDAKLLELLNVNNLVLTKNFNPCRRAKSTAKRHRRKK